ncbi:MAG: hypothetical protein D6753_03320 [Planctomycetota bacterium]|nr:MAG: hypothetical protein D6753_03320 [Planctomycetota bacterium]
MPEPPHPEDQQPSSAHFDDATRFASDGDGDLEFEFDPLADASGKGPLGVLGEYLLLEPIGAGGMGQVFRAEHRTMNRHVALKVLSREFAQRPDLVERFFAEIRAIARLMHPNIVTAFDAGSFGEELYLVMELVEGELLSQRVRRAGPMSTADAVNVLEQAARALEYAHNLGIIHRDIKPGNMMLNRQGVLKILDFGLAQFASAKAVEKKGRVFMGTPEFMSPEQIEDPDRADARSDLYSLGATLFYMLTGRPMFTGEKMQVARAQLRQKPPPLFVARSDVDLRLDAVFQKLVAKDPGERYASATELLDSLQELNLSGAASGIDALPRGGWRLAGDAPTSMTQHRSTLAKSTQIVGFDMGMLASTAAYYDPALGPQVLSLGDGSAKQLRNMVWNNGDRLQFGAQAAAQRQTDPEHVIHSFQRWIGLRELGRPFLGRRVPPEILLAAMIKHVMQLAAREIEATNSILVTVPACYDQLHRRAIRAACQIAGADLVQLLDKPMAAALNWYEVQQQLAGAESRMGEMRLLYVHLGGSAMEAAVLECRENTVRQLAVSGDWRLGIQRWQARLAEHLARKIQTLTNSSIREDVTAATRLQRTVELAMDRLVHGNKVDIRFQWRGVTLDETFTQEQLLAICPDLTEALLGCIQQACQSAGMDPAELRTVLLAGSMLRMKQLQQILRRVVPPAARLISLDKSELARGAAIQAHYVNQLRTDESQIPHAVGCTSYDFAVLPANARGAKPRVVLDRGTPVPASIRKSIRLPAPDGKKEHREVLQFVESTRSGGRDWRRLGLVDVRAAFPERKPDDPVQLRMEVDESGIMESSLIWVPGNQQTHLTAIAENELSLEQIRRWRHWLEDAMLCARQ